MNIFQKSGNQIINSLLNKSIKNNAIETNTNLIDLAMAASHLRERFNTHCIICSQATNFLIKGGDINLFRGSETYFTMLSSIYYNKNVTKILYDKTENLWEIFDIIDYLSITLIIFFLSSGCMTSLRQVSGINGERLLSTTGGKCLPKNRKKWNPIPVCISLYPTLG